MSNGSTINLKVRTGRVLEKALLGLLLLIGIAAPGRSGILVDIGVDVYDLEADPVRSVFYATNGSEIVSFDALTGTIGTRVFVPEGPRAIGIAPDGSRLYATLSGSPDIVVFDLPELTYSTSFRVSGSFPVNDLVVGESRIFAVSPDGLFVIGIDGVTLYAGDPPDSFTYSLALSPNERRLYALDIGVTPASVFVYDVDSDIPTYAGEDCCHGCIGDNAGDIALAPDGGLAYIASGGTYRLQVFDAVPNLRALHAGLTGPYPNAIAPSQDGSKVFVGYSKDEFAIVRTSDWLTFHVGPLQGPTVAGGMALSQGQQVLAVVIEYQGFEPNRVELIDVSSPVANRGGIRVSPVSSETGQPIVGAYVDVPAFSTESAYVDVRAGTLGSGPIEQASSVSYTVSASNHKPEEGIIDVVAGSWADVGELTLAHTGGFLPGLAGACANPAAGIGTTSTISISGLGFLPSPNLAVMGLDGLVIEDFSFIDWSTLEARVSVDETLPAGLAYESFWILLPEAQDVTVGNVALVDTLIFADGFESGDLSGWTP